MKIKKTHRGFQVGEFEDYNGVGCSIQKSSIATDDLIWLGCDDADPKHLVPGEGWKPLEVPVMTNFNTRMHLTRKMVKRLLPTLQKFADTGELK